MLGSRLDCPNKQPPAWPLERFERPACFEDPRDWRAWLEDYRRTAHGGELKALQRGTPPNHCADCAPDSEFHRRALARGRCIPIRVIDTTEETAE